MLGSDGTNMLTEMTASALSRMTVARCGAVRAEGGMGNTRRKQGTKKPPTLFGGASKGNRHRYQSRRLSLSPTASSVTRIAPRGSAPRYGRLPAASTAMPCGAELEPGEARQQPPRLERCGGTPRACRKWHRRRFLSYRHPLARHEGP